MIYCSLLSLLMHVFSTEVVTSTVDIRGLNFILFWKFERIQMDNDSYWQNSKISKNAEFYVNSKIC